MNFQQRQIFTQLLEGQRGVRYGARHVIGGALCGWAVSPDWTSEFSPTTGVSSPPWRNLFTQAETIIPALHVWVCVPFYFSKTVPLLDKSVRLCDYVDFVLRSQLSPVESLKVKFDKGSEYVMSYLVDLTYYPRKCSFAQK